MPMPDPHPTAAEARRLQPCGLFHTDSQRPPLCTCPSDPTATEPEQGEKERMARFRIALMLLERRDRCYCGQSKGHVGWLVCVEAEAS